MSLSITLSKARRSELIEILSETEIAQIAEHHDIFEIMSAETMVFQKYYAMTDDDLLKEYTINCLTE